MSHSLRQLTEKYPQFIPAHLKLAEVCKEKAEACNSNAQEGTPKNAIEVLERATFNIFWKLFNKIRILLTEVRLSWHN